MDVPITECHAIWSKRAENRFPLERQFDGILSDYVYYPEEEWTFYNMRPPDTYPLVASWRDKQGKVFIFLLEINQSQENNKPDYLVFVAGDSRLVKSTSNLIGEHKGNLEKIEKRDLAGKRADKSLQDEISRKSIERFTKIVGIFAVIVNGFSLYLRSMPAPKIGNELLRSIYEAMIVLIHFGALSLLFLIILLAIAYIVKFGALMLGRGT